MEDILEEFANKSLLFVDNHSKPFLYYLHDLQLDFLVEQNRTQLEVSNGVIQQIKCTICRRNDAAAQDNRMNAQFVYYL